jgi:hypothetical protein
LDAWTFSVSATPNAVRYWGSNHRAARYPAYDVETSGQWHLFNGFYATAGAGYYLFSGANSPRIDSPTIGYAYGNLGLAFEWQRWRIDVGYFLTQDRAQHIFPYPYVNNRFAGTVSWRF